jgi:nicotinamidase-related amidase
MRCIIDTVRATTRLGRTLHPFRRQRGRDGPSNTGRGCEIRPEFEPKPGEIVAAEHWCSSGFANTDLDFKKHGIHQLIVIGLLVHTCIEAVLRRLKNLRSFTGYDIYGFSAEDFTGLVECPHLSAVWLAARGLRFC